MATLLAGATLVSAAETEPAADPVPWHVPDAAVRVPVTISPESAARALGRMPPDVYLSELKPIKADGLTFLPETTNTPKDRFKGHSGKPNLYGTATYALKPEYTHFSCWSASQSEGYPPPAISFDEGKTFVGLPRGGWSGMADAGGLIGQLFDRSTTDAQTGSALVAPIPPGSKTITLKCSYTDSQAKCHYIPAWYAQELIRQAGFLTRQPSVASVDFQLPDRDPSALVTLVYTAAGKRVGCRALWAKLGEPVVLQFDYSGGETQYTVYWVERSKNPPPLAWEPKAGVVMESRLAKSYDPAIQTLEGFRKLWAESDALLGRNEVFSIYGFWFPFRPTTELISRYRRHPDGNQLHEVAGRKHLALTTFTGAFHVPYTGQYEFLYSAEEAAYFLIDGKLVSRMGYNEARELWDGGQGGRGVRVSDRWVNVNAHGNDTGYKSLVVDLTKGMHQLEFLVYGATQRFRAAILMRRPGCKEFHPMGVSWGHGGFCTWEPIAAARAGLTERRGQQLSASFSYKRITDTSKPWYDERSMSPYLASYPGLDAYNMFFTAHLSQKIEGAIYRWRFDDGSIREGGPESPEPFHNNPDGKPWNQIKGKVVFHTFLSSGLKTVHLEVLEGPDGKVIAQTSGKVYVQARWEYPISGYHQEVDQPLQCLLARESEFMDKTPIAELASLYHRVSFQRSGGWAELHDALVEAMTHRVDELIKEFPYSRLLDWGTELASPALAKYDAAQRLLETVMERAPAGGYHWNVAATELARFRAHARPEQALEMVRMLKETAPIVDMSAGWKLAPAKQWHFLPASGIALPSTAKPDGLAWSDITFPLPPQPVCGAAGLWLSKDFTLPASRKGKELVIEFGPWFDKQDVRIRDTWAAAIWCNGKWVGDLMDEWPDGRVVIPAEVQNAGGDNRLTLLFQNAQLPHMFDQGIDSFGVISPDLKRLAWADRYSHRIQFRRTDKTWWDTNPGELAGHAYRIRSLAFSADSRRLASGSHDKTIKLWDTDNGKELQTFRGHTGTPRVLAFSPDGRQLASAGEEGTVIRVWDTGTGAALRTITGHTDVVRALAWSPDGKLLASGSKDQTIKLWDSATGALRVTLEAPSSPVIELTFAPDSRRLASASGTGDRRTVTVWDVADAKTLREIGTGIRSARVPLAFTPDGAALLMGTHYYGGESTGPGLFVEPATGTVLRVILPPTKETPVVAGGDVPKVVEERGSFQAEAVFSPDGKQFAAWGGTAVTLWDAKTGQPLRQLKVDGSGWRKPEWHAGKWVEDVDWAQWNRQFQLRGPQEVNRENMHVPMPLYLTEACEQLGVNVAYYVGTDGKLPDFAKAEPSDTATQAQIDLSMRRRDESFGMIFTGYLQVTVEREYPFEWRADAHTTVSVGGKDVGNRGKVFLTAGAHLVTVTYRQQGKGSNPALEVTLPYTVVPGSEVVATRIEADALLAMGKREEAVKILTELNPFAWPLPPEEQQYVEQARMRIRRFSRSGRYQGQYALPIIDSWLFSHPMLRLDPEFMVSVIEAYANMGDRSRAFLLADQMLREEMNDGQRRILILTQVKVKLNEGDLPAAGQVYRKLKALAPQSDETIEARELIRATVIKKGKT